MYHSKKIGVFISHVMGYYQKNVCQGIIDKAAEYGYTTEIFTTLDGENLGDYGIGEESILHAPNYADFSGMIFASETYPYTALREQIFTTLQEKCTCPVVEIAVTNQRFPAISMENNSPASDLTKHLITVHHYKRICYLGCTAEQYFSDQRKDYYCSALLAEGYPVEECNILACDYTDESIAAALTAFLSSKKKPDAVVCYNDRIALLFMMACIRAGYRVPDDIAITGFDCTQDGANTTPALTTVSFPVYTLGSSAVEKLIALLHGDFVPATTTVTAEPIYKNSCGCHQCENMNAIFFNRTLNHRIVSLESSILGSMRMAAAFQRISDIDDGMDILEQYIQGIEHCREFYLCLYVGWDSTHDNLLQLTDFEETREMSSDEILLKLAIRDGKRLPECSFQKSSLLPGHIYDFSDSAYIYTPLFFENREFGYIALSYEGNQLDYHFQLVHWFLNINQMLQSICEAKHTSQLSSRLEDLYATDNLTGLYNKQGFLLYGKEFLLSAAISSAAITQFFFVFDKLDEIIGAHGHSEGEFAVEVVSHALCNVARPEDLLARIDENEFCLLAAGYDKKEADDLLARVDKYLDNYRKLSQKTYQIIVHSRYLTDVKQL